MKYTIRVSYETIGYVEVEADNDEEALDKAAEAVESGGVDQVGEFDEPTYDYEIEEIDE